MPRSLAYATLLLALGALPAHAQLRRETSAVAAPGYGLAAPDVPEAVVLNPAALAFLPSWGLAYVHADSSDEARMLRGNGFYAATPLVLGLAAGVAVDSVRPTSELGQAERTMISFALAWSWLDSLSLGAALRVLTSDEARLGGLTTLDLATSWRPTRWLALTFAARDVVGPGYRGGIEGGIPRSFWLATGFRPLGDRSLTLDLAGAVDENGRLGGRVAAEVTLPYLGRALVALEVEDVEGRETELRATAGVAVDWGQLGVGGGVLLGDGYGSSPGGYASVRVEGTERPGIPRDAYVLDLRLEGIGPRGIVQTVRQLDRALHDERVVGVLLRPRGSGIGMAYAQELRLMVEALRERGKRVVCHLEDADGSEWYACAGADRVLLDPAGGVRLTGPSSEVAILGDLLRNAGIRADFVRIGEQKTAIEQFMNSRESEPGRRQTEAVLDWAYRRLVFDASHDLGVTEARIAEVIDGGPHLPREARTLGLVTTLADEQDMGEELREAFGGSYGREAGFPDEVPARWGHRPRIGVVVVDGDIVDGDNVDIPLLGIRMSGGRTITRAIARLAEDPAVVAIVVRIDSPGGSVLASDQIYRAIVRARERKPVIASMGAMATSGGYYVAAPCQEIWADPSTVTGSIGIWFGKVDLVPLGEMIGVHLEQVGRGQRSGATSLFRPFTPEERAVLARTVREWYRAFLRRVARGRGMSVREVDALGRGRLWMGEEAVENGLVDRLGGFGSALAAARRAAGVGPETEVEIVPWRPSTLLDFVLGSLGMASAPRDGVSSEAHATLFERVAPELRAALGAVITLRQLGSAAPLALAPEVVVPRAGR